MPLCDHCGDRVRLKMKYTPNECLQKGYTYSVPLRLKVRLISWEKDAATKSKRLKHIKEQEVYFGDIPLMTEKGTFIFNGIERVVVSQLQRSPGVFFRPGETKGFFIGKIIPYRGAWVEFEYDAKNTLFVRLDRKKKFLASVFLRALGFGSDEEIIRLFYQVYKIIPEDGKLYWELADDLVGKDGRRGRHRPQIQEGPGPGQEEAHARRSSRNSRTRASPGLPLVKKDLQGAYSLSSHQGQGQGERGDRRHGPRPPHRHGRAVRGLLPRPGRDRHDRQQHPQEGPAEGHQPGPGRDLPEAAAGRAPHHGERPQPLPQPVLQPPEIQLLAGSAG